VLHNFKFIYVILLVPTRSGLMVKAVPKYFVVVSTIVGITSLVNIHFFVFNWENSKIQRTMHGYALWRFLWGGNKSRISLLSQKHIFPDNPAARVYGYPATNVMMNEVFQFTNKGSSTQSKSRKKNETFSWKPRSSSFVIKNITISINNILNLSYNLSDEGQK
jgi:hypothetical protein